VTHSLMLNMYKLLISVCPTQHICIFDIENLKAITFFCFD